MGRGFLPETVTTISNLKSQIKKLQEMVSRKEMVDSSSPKEIDNGPELVFYEKLASKKEDVIKNWKPERHSDSPEKKPAPQEIMEPQPPPVEEEEKEVIDTVKEVRDSLISESRYTVQIASIGDIDKAEKMVRQLVKQGYDAYYYETNVKGKVYYRIRCGRFASWGEATNYARKLKDEAGLKGFVSRTE